MKTSEVLIFHHNLINQGFNDKEVDTLFDSKPINIICHMNAKNIKFAKDCEFNYLWFCKHPHSYGQDCTGPCKNCTTTQLNNDSVICPICDNSVESGYCINKLCVNHV